MMMSQARGLISLNHEHHLLGPICWSNAKERGVTARAEFDCILNSIHNSSFVGIHSRVPKQLSE